MLKGFKEFIMRGNVIDLAVAVIIGNAFTAVVNSVANSLINPLIASFGGNREIGLAVKLIESNDKSVLDFGAVLTALINFLIIAAVVYFMIMMPVRKVLERRRRGEEPPPPEPTDVELLTEIRDLLRQQQTRGQAP
ncbi:MAG TPA: large-conductance mechanosensitive channel protein MscL [Actinophytocola sp.]|uniref:large-conductance mechanosensitive channel protein MscL n=1 Tax=Actinophytocola sp. TaxID=1872138 RepID=UPI002DDCC83C|nr:large-conductance mechanosensitive channel protein MscL [Actinophytocola sp.]HEV2778756.1 large-conductance mechanosensitive channel protein MscL [Actinophytocola sp.]